MVYEKSLIVFKFLFQSNTFCCKTVFLVLTIGLIRNRKFYITITNSRIQIVRSKIISIFNRQ